MTAPPKKASTLGGYLLGLVPLGAGVVLGTLCLPRAIPPEDVPVPVANGQVLAQVRAADQARAAKGPLPDDVRSLGTALRTFNAREAKQGVDPYVTPTTMNEARMAVDLVLGPLLIAKSDDALLALRASQLESFVGEMHAFERTGAVSPELEALGGAFVRRLTDVGWCHERTCAVDDDALRVMFKLAWDALVRLERPPFDPTLDEERALYAFYLRHPHAPEATRKRIDEAAGAARTPKACRALAEGEALAAEQWRLEKLKRLAQIDPDYPAAYAIGVSQYRRKNFGAAADSFRDWIDAHPDGRWTLRARNYLRASVESAAAE